MPVFWLAIPVVRLVTKSTMHRVLVRLLFIIGTDMKVDRSLGIEATLFEELLNSLRPAKATTFCLARCANAKLYGELENCTLRIARKAVKAFVGMDREVRVLLVLVEGAKRQIITTRIGTLDSSPTLKLFKDIIKQSHSYPQIKGGNLIGSWFDFRLGAWVTTQSTSS